MYMNTDKIQQIDHKWHDYLFDYDDENDKIKLIKFFKPI